MYHFPNQQLYHHNIHNPYQHCPIEDTKLQNLNTITEAHYRATTENAGCNNAQLLQASNVEQPTQVFPLQSKVIESVKKKKTTSDEVQRQTVKNNQTKKAIKKPAVDTSTFTIAERLVAAVWVHERKFTSSTISQIKHDFRRRFGRDPPSKTTLFAWERKLFSTGSVCDAPRTGRPVNRTRHMGAVCASVSCAPALSLRARARALRLPRSTLHYMLRHDLPRAHPQGPENPPQKKCTKRSLRSEPAAARRAP